MKKLLMLMSSVLLAACGLTTGNTDEDPNAITSRFNSTWNIYESFENESDGTITYHALPWGGLVGSFKERNMPVDWSSYESITVEFSEPTEVPIQIMLSDELKTWGKKGLTSLTCYFDGRNVTSVSEVALQASDTTTLHVKSVLLTPATGYWVSVPVWQGECVCGDWEKGFIVNAEKFAQASDGDKVEVIYSVDQQNPNVGFWLLKTIYNGDEATLEGNDNELNEWGCALMNKDSQSYRIVLTGKDIINLRKKGMFVNGYYCIVTQVNLLKKVIPSDTGEMS